LGLLGGDKTWTFDQKRPKNSKGLSKKTKKKSPKGEKNQTTKGQTWGNLGDQTDGGGGVKKKKKKKKKQKQGT